MPAFSPPEGQFKQSFLQLLLPDPTFCGPSLKPDEVNNLCYNNNKKNTTPPKKTQKKSSSTKDLTSWYKWTMMHQRKTLFWC